MDFNQMHQQSEPLLLCNVWDVNSAKVASEAGFSAIGTSSAAMAASLGYADGEQMSFSELRYLVERIRASVSLPLTVDLEAGYSEDPQEIVQNIEALTRMGVVGINLEDSLANGQRGMVPLGEFSELLVSVLNGLQANSNQVFVNVRTDSFLLGTADPLAETLKRTRAYEKAGANGIFVPGMVVPKEIQEVVAAIDLPLNLMCMPSLPDFPVLGRLGVKRISMGNFLFEKNREKMAVSLAEIVNAQSFQPILNS